MSSTEVFAEVLCSGDYSRCLAELEEVSLSSLWPRNGTLRALASLLTAEEPQVSKAAADYLSSGASNKHFRTRVSSAEDKRECHLECRVGCSQLKPHLNVVCVVRRLWSATLWRCQRQEFRARGPPAPLSAVCRSVSAHIICCSELFPFPKLLYIYGKKRGKCHWMVDSFKF